MPAQSFVKGAELRIAQAISMQAITGEYSYDAVFPDADPDILLIPDYSSLKMIPWSTVPRAFAIHDCVLLDGRLCPFAPRSILKNVLARYQALGLTPVVAPEIEFYLTEANTDPNVPFKAPISKSGRTENGQSAFSMNMLNELAPFWDEFNATIDAMGIKGDTWIHEMGLSQYEINLVHGNPLALADQAFMFKYAAKEIAIKHGMNAVFMAKPIAGQPGSSMHLHQSVVDNNGVNIFSHSDGSDTERFHHYIGGLQKYLPDLMLLFAPNINSFRRYISGSQAPINLSWGVDNRTTGLRVPLSVPSARRVENRIAGADANPYLMIAASLAAGLAGLEEKIAATEPVIGNAYDNSHDLAPTFLAALMQMRQSESARRLLGDDFVAGFVSVKEIEFQSYLAEIGAWERRFLGPQS
ncbi:glutamine synthetase family protein [Shewanella glacialipiscicola]|uniref:Glutamine synthetase n=2 Tax=Shewanella glacialipiscicola TaxID=614069 RepID=A0ABQ6J3D2_9GAMM|nr:glutamine synthetase family protein [Shewanella glacialipiscicola]MCL1085879.1 glutamine synthetase family protein [Shewanella glacialipiscicola]GIU09217.1 glutamine synthetase [Shewanella glacialipiscicola]GMA82021.1 glutamine synthetase [Shewanella glacialipiscicola]